MAFLRDTAVGQVLRFVTRNHILKYPEEEEGFKLPETWQRMLNSEEDPEKLEREVRRQEQERGTTSNNSSSSNSVHDGHDDDDEREQEMARQLSESKKEQDEGIAAAPPVSPTPRPLALARTQSDRNHQDASLQRTRSRQETQAYTEDRFDIEQQEQLDRTKSIPIVPRRTKDGAILVDWYYSDDPENPQNWTNLHRGLITALICVYTFVVYTSSAIYVTSTEGVAENFHVTLTEASLGLSLFVLGYGIGPLLFSPLSEIPSIGRNPIYIVTMFLFVIVSIPAPFVDNYAGLMVLRFLQGFFGSPCLASGAASLGDMYSMMALPFALVAWVSAAYCGPALGPLLSGFSVPAKDWRWSLLEILWASAPVFVAMFLLLPETSTPNLLYRRAQRLRKLTGSERFLSQAEIDQRNLDGSAVVMSALVKPFEISFKDPAVLFTQIYTAIIYG
jgi:MFS transporter, DHA1 family, multidrug resistance protein